MFYFYFFFFVSIFSSLSCWFYWTFLRPSFHCFTTASYKINPQCDNSSCRSEMVATSFKQSHISCLIISSCKRMQSRAQGTIRDIQVLLCTRLGEQSQAALPESGNGHWHEIPFGLTTYNAAIPPPCNYLSSCLKSLNISAIKISHI